MATSDERSPFSRPGFIVAAVVIAVIAVAGAVLGVIIASRPEPSPIAAPSESPTSTQSTQVRGGGSSVCGLDGEVLKGTVSIAPEAQWQYQGTTAYPTSSEFGPGATDPAGFRYCFQHSPEGALFAAANALSQGSDSTVAAAWIKYFLAEGPYRDELLAAGGGSGPTSGSNNSGTRLKIVGFRILAYDGETARIDLAVTASVSGKKFTLSGAYELVWQNGDWKISADVAQPLDMATIPNTSGYVTFGE